MNQLSENRRLSVWLVSIVTIIAWGTVLVVSGLIASEDIIKASKYLGLATLVALIFAWIWNRYLWRIPIIRDFLRIPDLSGRWEGWYLRALTGELSPTVHEITQHALEIGVNAWGPNNLSRGLATAIIVDRHGSAPEFIWTYKTESTSDHPDPGDTHEGAHFLRLSYEDGEKWLKGYYINDRVRKDKTRGSVGNICIK